MADPQQPPDQQPPAEPTPAQATEAAAAGAEAAAEAIERGATPEQVREEVSNALDAKLREFQVRIPEDERNAIAAATIGQLEARGAFEPPVAPPEPPAPGEPAPTDPPAAPEEPPRKPSFAERFLRGG